VATDGGNRHDRTPTGAALCGIERTDGRLVGTHRRSSCPALRSEPCERIRQVHVRSWNTGGDVSAPELQLRCIGASFAMTVTVCPAATINAPIERVWSLLMDPQRWTDWSSARLEAAIPDGLLHVGQRLHFSSSAFGRRWHAVTILTGVAPERHGLDVDVSVPFGIVNHEHLSATSLPDGKTHVQFG
jgi:hypothetical protein